MIKFRDIIIIATALLSMPAAAAAQLDSAVTNALGARIDEYVKTMEAEPAEVKCGETDFLIEACSDSLIRQFTAVRLYGHYVSSALMGDEAVAIHIFDRWFDSGKVKMPNEADLTAARIFATFNRQSLIGNPAPELVMEDMDGNTVCLFGDSERNGRPSVLFFYDSGCPTCRMDAILLRNILGDGKYRVNLYAVYTGQSHGEWEKFAVEYLDIPNPETAVRHLWDPDISSDFQMKYGVLSTPGLFLVSGNGTILGRRLDVLSLKKLLELCFKPYEYGSGKSAEFYDRVFSSCGDRPSCTNVRQVCDDIASRTLAERDTTLFRQMTGDLMYWLGTRRGEGVRCGLEYLIDRYIAGRNDIWKSQDDSLKVISYSEVLKDLLSKSVVGGRLPGIEVCGILKHRGKDREKKVCLDRLRNATVIFHSEGCPFCEEELAAADSMSASDGKSRFFIVDMDRMLDSDPETAFGLFDALDLTVMPYITVVDKKGIVRRKYVSLTD